MCGNPTIWKSKMKRCIRSTRIHLYLYILAFEILFHLYLFYSSTFLQQLCTHWSLLVMNIPASLGSVMQFVRHSVWMKENTVIQNNCVSWHILECSTLFVWRSAIMSSDSPTKLFPKQWCWITAIFLIASYKDLFSTVSFHHLFPPQNLNII